MDMPQAGSGTLTPPSYRLAALKKSQELAIATNAPFKHGVLLAGLTQEGYSLYLSDSFDFLATISYPSPSRVHTVLAWEEQHEGSGH